MYILKEGVGVICWLCIHIIACSFKRISIVGFYYLFLSAILIKRTKLMKTFLIVGKSASINYSYAQKKTVSDL